ncbi:MAG: lysozyme [Acidovorax sp.]|uniref:glycoside hydrolase family protein n=1 Tax=Acidovorax sp. TaxID=1872122 RepID=UPI0039E2A676
MAFTPQSFVLALLVLIAAATIRHQGRLSAAHGKGRMRGAVSPRMLVAGLSLSFAAFVGLAVHENYTNTAVIPTQGDRPTVGFGSTFHENGSPVKMGDTTTPVRALIKAQAHISREEAAFRDSLPGVALHQGEYDLYMDWVYQYGSGAWLKSGMRRELLAGRYAPACDALLDYRKLTSRRKEGPGWVISQRDAQGAPVRWEFDCSTPGNKVCRGVWTRQQERHKKCMELQP